MSELSVPSDGSGYSLLLTCGVEWDITSKPDWVTVGPISTYTDGDQSAWYKSPKWKVHVSVAGNSGDSRSGSVVFTSASGFAELKVSQDSGLPPVVSVKEVKLDKSELTLYEGDSEQLTETVLPEDATDKTVTWSSSNTGVATVSNNGVVTAKSEGSAKITALAGGKKATCSITVKAQVIAVTSITLSPSTLMLMQGESQTLTATVYPSNATDKTVTWSSSNTGVATVSNIGVVTAKSEGSATITAVAGCKTGTCSVTVTHPSSGPEAIDLGLSVKWASCNVGARSPEEYGDYFAWGETEPKSDSYSWETYKWCNGSANTLIKYNNNSGYGAVDNKTVLDSSDDAARANWGGSWRMPTDAEWTELFRNCTWTWTSQNGVMGIKVTGPNRKSIFLPAAGDRAGTYLENAGAYGFYWSSSLSAGYPGYALSVYFLSDFFDWGLTVIRYCGQSVRPADRSGRPE